MSKKLFFSFFIVFLFSYAVAGYNNDNAFVCRGLNEEASYVSDHLFTYAQGGVMQVNGSDINKGSDRAPPLVADLDNDGRDEIVIFRETEVRVYEGITGGDLLLTDAYVNTTVNGSAAAVLNDGNNNGYPEIVVFNDHKTATGYTMMYLEFYGGAVHAIAAIEKIGKSTGSLVCDDFFGNTTEECMFIDTGDTIVGTSIYDRTGPVFNMSFPDGGSSVCNQNPLLSSMDFDSDGYSDLVFLFNSSCNMVKLYQNEYAGKGNFTPKATWKSDHHMAINQFSIAELDGGAKEFVYVASRVCSSGLSNGCDPGSKYYIQSLSTYTNKCSAELDKGWESPYVIGLFTCYNSDGEVVGGELSGYSQCDMDLDGDKDLLLAQVWRAAGSRLWNLTIGAYTENCVSLGVAETAHLRNPGTGTGDTYNSASYMKAITVNADTDVEYELIVPDGIADWSNDAGFVVLPGYGTVRLFDGVADSTQPWNVADSHLLVADLYGDNIVEIIEQASDSSLKVYAFGYNNYPPAFSTYSYAPNSPICTGETLTFTAYDVNDTEEQSIRLVASCYNNATNSTGSWFPPCKSPSDLDCLPNATVTCSYPQAGNYIVRMYLQDEFNSGSYAEYVAFHIQVEDSILCHVVGDGSSWSSTTGATSSTGAPGDITDALEGAYNEMGLQSSRARAFTGVVLLLILNGGLIAAMLRYGGRHSISFPLMAWITVIASFGLTLIRLFPAWYMVVLIFVSIALGVGQGMRHLIG